MKHIDELLGVCAALDIRLYPDEYGDLVIDGPTQAITDTLVQEISACKVALLRGFGSESEVLLSASVTDQALLGNVKRRICKCGSEESRDFPIHDGLSVRRDCLHCGRFIDFTIWYGELLDDMKSMGIIYI
jgi:hypothetical protein